jgi:hypothetical protein
VTPSSQLSSAAEQVAVSSSFICLSPQTER